MITIVDYGMCNVGSIHNMLRKIGSVSRISSDPQDIRQATKLILPGVGSFDAGIESLDRSGLRQALDERVRGDGVPVLGICLGMQLMGRCSEEGQRAGLGWVDAEVLRLRPGNPALKVPHMGWNTVRPLRSAPLIDPLPPSARFYFVHSYHVRCAKAQDVLMSSVHGEEFHSALHRDNVWGVQFHPEKSHRFGMQLMRNFAERC